MVLILKSNFSFKKLVFTQFICLFKTDYVATEILHIENKN